MIFNTQTDVRWRLFPMGLTEDSLGTYGCLVSCLSNIWQDAKKKQLTPADLNAYLKMHKGYERLRDRDIPENKASYIVWDVIISYFKIKLIRYIPVVQYENYPDRFYWIARILNNGGGHYINVLGKWKNYFICFDVYDGRVRYIKRGNITFFHRIEFLGKYV